MKSTMAPPKKEKKPKRTVKRLGVPAYERQAPPGRLGELYAVVVVPEHAAQHCSGGNDCFLGGKGIEFGGR